MKISPLTQIQIAAVLVTAIALLGCEGPATKASEQVLPVYPAAAGPVGTNLVTVTNLIAAPAEGEVPAKPVVLSDALKEVVKLAESGVSDDVVLAYIQSAAQPYNPTPDEIVYLTDLGLSDVLITALVNHRGTQPPAVAVQPFTNAPAVALPGQAATVPPTTSNPEAPVVYDAAPAVQYAPPVVEYNYFYSSLAPYGSWVDVANYGYCWQPTVAVIQTGWRPYSDRGRWLYTDCGYYWHSDYSWGWAPFHYGRWFHHPARGWCWRPDSVWGPAWVSWRYTDAHCGWAPLPPGAYYHAGVGFSYYGASVGVGFSFGLHRNAYTFVPAHRFHDKEVWRHRVNAKDAGNVYVRSRVINDYTDRNNTIVNRGIGAERVPALGRSEVPKVAVRDLPSRSGPNVRPDQVQQVGNETVIYRPKPPVVTPSTGGRTAATPADRTIRSQPGGGTSLGSRPASLAEQGGTSSAPSPRGRPESAPATVPDPRPVRAPSGGAAPSTLTGTPSPAAISPTRPALSTPSPISAAPPPSPRPQPPSSAVPQSGTTPEVVSRPEPVRTAPAVSPMSPTPRGAVGGPRPNSQPQPTSRQESPKAPTVAPPASVSSGAAPQTYRVPTRPSTPSWNQLGSSPNNTLATGVPSGTPAGPQASSPPAAVPRIERAKPATSIAPEKFTPVAPATIPQPSRIESPSRPSFVPVPSTSHSGPAVQSRPAPSYSPGRVRPATSFTAPAQTPSYTPGPVRPAPSYTPPAAPSRPAPSYTPPAVQTRPAPSYSAPAQSRPAAPAASRGSRPQQ